jgi:hypothetical protein
MANTFKSFNANDIVPTRTLLHESIPITGSIISGTYASEGNIKNYGHGLFQTVYDYPHLSSSANHIFDMTCGYANNSSLSSSTAEQNAKKINMYNQMAQILMGYDATGSILQFDQDGNITDGGTKMKECFFLSFSRLLAKDEIKKGSFNMVFGMSHAYSASFEKLLTVSDAGAQNDFRVNSPAGEYGVLSASAGGSFSGSYGSVGLLFYQAGIAVLTASIFMSTASLGGTSDFDVSMSSGGNPKHVSQLLTGSTISASVNALRHRIQNISFNNTTELNSTIHFCRANHNEFNYSSNPTYLSASKINVKNNAQDAPVAYVTTVGLYSPDNELMGVAKVSEPLKKDPTNELLLRVRLDY